jgi:putative flavoprotein involved in K+ transport
MSRCLAQRSIDHIVIERGEVANSWRTERWDSLRLLTPNWQSRLPGFGYEGEDPDGYRTVPEVATGACNIADVPAVAAGLPAPIVQMTPMRYRNPGQLPDGGVLVVGASATGTQIADELHRSGRPVTLAVGQHTRAPRLYRGRDIQWWMDAAGVLDERYDQVEDIDRARRVPSLQLTGSPRRATLDLNALTAIGVRLVGRLAGIVGGKAQFSGSLRNMCTMSDLKMARLLNTLDEWAAAGGAAAEVGPPERFAPTEVPASPALTLDLTSGEIKSIVWATGFRPDYSWLKVPVLDRKGLLRHDGGVTPSPGLYVMGLQFLRRRKSALIDGAADDARELSQHLSDHLARRAAHSAAKQ